MATSDDRRLIDNESSTTVDKFYGNKGGKDVQIPLADAAAVLAEQIGIKHHNLTIEKGSSTTISVSKACTIFVHENQNLKLQGIISKRSTEIAVSIGNYIGVGEESSQTLALYIINETTLGIKNNDPYSSMKLSVVIIS